MKAELKITNNDEVVITLDTGYEFVITTMDRDTALMIQKRSVNGLVGFTPSHHHGPDYLIIK